MKDVLVQRPLTPTLFRSGILLMLLAALPHAWHLELTVSGGFLFFLLLRLIFWPKPETAVSTWLRLLLLAASIGLVLYQADLTQGRQFGVTLLVLMAGMKILEMKTRRDLYILIFLAYFILVTLFLFYQTPLATAYVLLVSTSLTALLIGNNLATHGLPLKTMIGKASLMVLSSMPIMLLLFVLFPRLDGPLWSLNLGNTSGKTGISSRISMGSISQLSQSQEIAFRVRFNTAPPPPAQRYWRGLVLWHTDGRNWTRGKSHLPVSGFEPVSPVIEYEVTMEATNQPWLFPLDHVLQPIKGTIINTDGELGMLLDIKRRFTWKGKSSLQIRHRELTDRETTLGLQLPDTLTSRTKTLARSFQQGAENDQEVVSAALRYFNQQPFIYTLQPPILNRNPVDEFLFETRQGFCEHYATSFVILMRLAGIPARVVVGYQGGQMNPMGGHLIVRQSDAHAWAEVWLKGRGWTRIDPTSAVAPERIEHSIANLDYRSGSPVTFDLSSAPGFFKGLLRNALWLRDNLELQWHYWVVGFDSQRQKSLLEKLGMPNLDGYQLGLAAALGAIAMASLIFLLGMWRGRDQRDSLQKAYERFQNKLRRCGLDIPHSMGPEETGKQAARRFPHQADEIQAIVSRYISLRYGPHSTREVRKAFHARVRRFRCRNR